MSAKESQSAVLEDCRTSPQRTDPRILERRLQVAFYGIVGEAKRKPAKFYDLSETNRTVSYPFEREREFIHDAIRRGAATPDRVLSYYLARIQDDMAQFADPVQVSDVCYTRIIGEYAEFVEAATVARGLGTQDARERAKREASDVIPITQLYIAANAFPMGAPR